MLEIPPAGVEKTKIVLFFFEEAATKKAGYVVGNYDELCSEIIRWESRQKDILMVKCIEEFAKFFQL